jgi:hypothetical protein
LAHRIGHQGEYEVVAAAGRALADNRRQAVDVDEEMAPAARTAAVGGVRTAFCTPVSQQRRRCPTPAPRVAGSGLALPVEEHAMRGRPDSGTLPSRGSGQHVMLN